MPYDYAHHMLFSNDAFTMCGCEQECDGECVSEFDEEAYDEFIAEIMAAFGQKKFSVKNISWKHNHGGDIMHLGYTDYTNVYIDAGDSRCHPCIFAESRKEESFNEEDEEYDIVDDRSEREIITAFNQLCNDWPTLFKYSTSSYTSQSHGTQYAAVPFSLETWCDGA